MTVNRDKLEEFGDLYNNLFFDAAAIQSLHDYLKNSILPQMLGQGDQYCFVGLIADRYVYAVFGHTDVAAMEQYWFSKEVDKFIQSSHT